MRAEATKDEFFDEEIGHEVKDQHAKEEDLISNVSEAFGKLIKLHGPAFMPMFDDGVAQGFASFFVRPTHRVYPVILFVFVSVIFLETSPRRAAGRCRIWVEERSRFTLFVFSVVSLSLFCP